MGTIYIGGSSGGGGTYTIQNLTADGTVTGFDYMVLVDASAGNVKVTLPTTNSSTTKGHSISVKRIDSSQYSVTIIPSINTEMIDGVVNGIIYLYGQNDAVTISSIGNGDCKISSDNRNSTGSTASSIYCRRTTQQTTGLVDNSTIIFDNASIIGSNISYNSTTGVFTLKPNITYRLTGSLGEVRFSNSGWCRYQWYNVTNSSNIGVGGGGDNLTTTANSAPAPLATNEFTPTIETQVKLVAVSVNNVTGYGYNTSLPYANIEEVSKQATILNATGGIACLTSNAKQIISSQATWTNIAFSSIANSNNITASLTSGTPVTIKRSGTYEITFSGSADENAGTGNFYQYRFLKNGTPFYISSENWLTASVMGTFSTTITQDFVVGDVINVQGYWSVGTTNTFNSSALKVNQLGSIGVSKIDSTLIDAPWIVYTPTIGGTTTAPTLSTANTLKGAYRVVGKTLHLKFLYYASSNIGATPGAGVYTFSIPSDLTINTTIATLPSVIAAATGNLAGGDAMPLGYGHASASTATSSLVKVVALSNSTLGLLALGGNNTLVGVGNFTMNNSGMMYQFTAEIPIL